LRRTDSAMRVLLIVAICFALLAAGCVEQKDSTRKGDTKVAEENVEKLTVTITSPKAGEILTGNKEASFEASVKGGREPYAYKWNSNIDDVLSTSQSFRQSPAKLSKGQHYLILNVIDGSGASAQGSVIIHVM